MKKIILKIVAMMFVFQLNARVNWKPTTWPPQQPAPVSTGNWDFKDGWTNCGENGCKVCEKLTVTSDCTYNKAICEFKFAGETITLNISFRDEKSDECRGSGKDRTCGHAIHRELIKVNGTEWECHGWQNGHGIDYANGCSGSSLPKTKLNELIESKRRSKDCTNLTSEARVINSNTACQANASNINVYNNSISTYHEISKCNDSNTKSGSTTAGSFTQYCGISDETSDLNK